MATDTDTATDRRTRPRLASLADGRLFSLCLGSSLLVLASLLVQVSFGTYSMSIAEAWGAVLDPLVWTNPQVLLRFLFGEGLGNAVAGALGLSTAAVDLPTATNIVWNIRLPRVLVAVFVGMALAVSGAIFQAVTRNELASPFILGVSSGAGLTVLLTLVVFSGFALVVPFTAGSVVLSATALLPLTAALGGAVAFGIVYAIAWKGGTSPVRLVLAGVIVSTVFQSLQTALFTFASDIGVVQQALAWTTGSLTGVAWPEVRIALPGTVLAVVLALALARQLNVLLLGESTARSLGMPVERMRFALSAVAILAAASAIAVAGIVSFVGLIVPHVVRNVVGSDYTKLVVGCLFVGPALLCAADVGARLFFEVAFGQPQQLHVGIVTGLVGGPYFLYLMRRQDEMGEL
ncbi:FecCD family ABC transporter permease [Halomarina oriensis]|uniref:Iron chelate uptake ABC transporter family permease subunit n=1 Tax=Halomarina oriensis TaxID=671145 RepID=A0A6B0GIT0_9EURY|nr:iron ABC transporter permease [Halomarina oriensis]MWG34782.1 iron chelate uptake ABC transporter family permease subunit [Halomarina oriensis]